MAVNVLIAAVTGAFAASGTFPDPTDLPFASITASCAFAAVVFGFAKVTVVTTFVPSFSTIGRIPLVDSNAVKGRSARACGVPNATSPMMPGIVLSTWIHPEKAAFAGKLKADRSDHNTAPVANAMVIGWSSCVPLSAIARSVKLVFWLEALITLTQPRRLPVAGECSRRVQT